MICFFSPSYLVAGLLFFIFHSLPLLSSLKKNHGLPLEKLNKTNVIILIQCVFFLPFLSSIIWQGKDYRFMRGFSGVCGEEIMWLSLAMWGPPQFYILLQIGQSILTLRMLDISSRLELY